jgi:hypothetical protein
MQDIIEALGLSLVGTILNSDGVRQSVFSHENKKTWTIECDYENDFDLLVETFNEVILKGYESDVNTVRLQWKSLSGVSSKRIKFNIPIHIKSPLIQVSTPVICQKVIECQKPVLVTNNNTHQVYMTNNQWRSLNIYTTPEEWYRVTDSSVLWVNKADLAFVIEKVKCGDSIENFRTLIKYPEGSEREIVMDVRPVSWLGVPCRAEIHKDQAT